MKVVLYLRVSTFSQNYESQREELTDYCNKSGHEVVSAFAETISGAKKNTDRPELTKMIEFIKGSDVKKVIVWEASRLGRDTLEVLKTIQILNDNCISLYIKNWNIETLDEDCKVNAMSTLMLQILSSVSEMEKTQIRQRMKRGYESYRAKGGKVGRKGGYKLSDIDLLKKHHAIVKKLKKKTTVRDIALSTKTSTATVMKIKKLLFATSELPN